ncbi:MAG: hypothetical protein ACYSWU_00890 [Planctomycetota bacterium]
MKNHVRLRGHRVQMLEVGPAKMAHCMDCGGQWFNMEAAAYAAANDSIENMPMGFRWEGRA